MQVGYINNIQIVEITPVTENEGEVLIAVALGRESKAGRWAPRISEAKNNILLLKI
jgi:hypothetical protein